MCVSVCTHTHVYFDQASLKNLKFQTLHVFYSAIPQKNEVNEDKRRKGGLIGTSGRAEFKTDALSY